MPSSPKPRRPSLLLRLLALALQLPLLFFFFSSRRRHTRFDCDWSSDVCSSDLIYHKDAHDLMKIFASPVHAHIDGVRSEERRVGKSVDLGGRRIIKKKK